LAKIQESCQDVQEFLRRHVAGDWGDLGPDDKAANEVALQDGSRLLSKYHTNRDEAIWIITEAVGDDGKRASRVCCCRTVRCRADPILLLPKDETDRSRRPGYP
jgi:hypothetical protein